MKLYVLMYGFSKAGGYRVLSKLPDTIKSGGNEVVFIAFRNNNSIYYNTQCPIIDIDIKGKPTRDLRNNKITGWRGYLNRLLAFSRYIKKNHLENENILVHDQVTAFAARLSRARKIVYYIQAYEPDFYQTKNIKNILLRYLSQASYNIRCLKIVNSKALMHYKKINTDYCVYPGLDLKVYYEKARKKNGDKIKIGCIGRKEANKGTKYILEAYKLLQKEYGNIFDFTVAFLDVESEYILSEYPDGDENLSNYYRSLDILVACVGYETKEIHYPVIEAMACGTTVIASGTYPSSDENAFLVPVCNPSAIAQMIIYIVNHPEEALIKRKKAVEDIKEFDWDLIGKQFCRIIDKEV